MYRYLILSLFLSIGFYSIAQTSSDRDKLSHQADSLMQVGEYVSAKGILQNLLNRYPQDPALHLAMGRCYLSGTRSMDKAIEYLQFASTRDVSNMVYYYLGEAHFLAYRFDEAISYYRRFTINGGDPSVSREQIEFRLSQCENGKFMLSFVYSPEVVDRKTVHSDEFHLYINTQSNSGSFVPKPESLKTRVDKAQGDSSLIFFPHNPEPGDRVFYSSYGSTTSFGKDIYMIEMQDDARWSKPIELGDAINTPLDEDYPYLSSDGVTLYFASKGHYSMGGYDLYKSAYNPSTGIWGPVENLGFPISSTYNDYIYVPNDDENLATVVTDRNLKGDSVDVVVVRVEDAPIRRAITAIESIAQIARLEPDEETPPIPVHNGTVESSKPEPMSASFTAVENDPEYTRVLSKGFEQQMLSDSLRVRLEELRQRFDYVTTAQQRVALEERVVKVEDALLGAQKKADTYFAMASQIEQEYLTGARTPADRPTSSFATDKPEFLYQAQFASTVFHSDELNQLARLENAVPQIESLRRNLIAAKKDLNALDDTLPGHQDAYVRHLNLKERFVETLKPHVSGKKKIYSDCISVALVKRGAVDQQVIRNEVNIANQHFRNATTIRNNAADDTRIQSEYEALLLEELGVIRLEIAFAKVWGMILFEQEKLSKTYRLEQNAFGRTLTASTPTEPDKTRPPQHEADAEQHRTQIMRMEPKSSDVDIIFDDSNDTTFIVLDRLPYNDHASIPDHLPLPDGVVYKIQLAAFSNPPKLSFFKGMYPIWVEPVNNGRITKYYTGIFTHLNSAEDALTTVRGLGFRDAFVVAWHNGRSVSPSRAQSLEGRATEAPTAPTLTLQDDNSNHIFFIQIGPYQGGLADEVAQTVRAMAPGKDISRKSDGQGAFIYSIGSFESHTEVNRVKDNMVASGIGTAVVVAVEVDND